jgi:hypothetical protein
LTAATAATAAAAATTCLQARGTSGKPLLEVAYRQAVVVVDELKRIGLPAALVLDVPGLCCPTSSSGSGGGAAPQS